MHLGSNPDISLCQGSESLGEWVAEFVRTGESNDSRDWKLTTS